MLLNAKKMVQFYPMTVKTKKFGKNENFIESEKKLHTKPLLASRDIKNNFSLRSKSTRTFAHNIFIVQTLRQSLRRKG